MLRKIEDRGALEMAKRVRQHVSSIFEFDVATRRAKTDPASPLRRAMKANPKVKHRAAIREGDLRDFFEQLADIDMRTVEPSA